jgi:hypothetical protein
MSPPAKMPARPVIIGVDGTTPSSNFSLRHPRGSQVGVLAERQHQRVGLELLELAGRLREALLVERHLLDQHLAFVDVLDRREPLDHHAFLLGLLTSKSCAGIFSRCGGRR